MNASNAAKLAGVLDKLDVSEPQDKDENSLSDGSTPKVSGKTLETEGTPEEQLNDDPTLEEGKGTPENKSNGSTPDSKLNDGIPGETEESSVESEGTPEVSANTETPLTALTNKVESLTTQLVQAKQTLASVQADSAVLKSDLAVAKANADSMKTAVSELLEVYDIRLGVPEKDRSALTSEELILEFSSVSSKFRDSFPDGKVVKLADDKEEGLPSSHSQVASFPFSKVK